ncbi:MAG: putative Zn-dependent protease [Cellvibrionaceae bacterium]|jgi:predicted Zn-dependent protease
MKKLLLNLLAYSLLLNSIGTFASDQKIRQIGNYASMIVENNNALLFDDQVLDRVTKIGKRLTNTLGYYVHYKYRILNSPIINAWATPNGYIYISTGLLDHINNEAELAAVISHEIAHVNQNHLIRSYEQAKIDKQGTILGASLGAAIIGVTLYKPTAAVSSDSNFTSSQDFAQNILKINIPSINHFTKTQLQGYSKSNELEADIIAYQIVSRAGYNPVHFISLLKRMRQSVLRIHSLTENYSSHFINASPGLEKRISVLEAYANSLK